MNALARSTRGNWSRWPRRSAGRAGSVSTRCCSSSAGSAISAGSTCRPASRCSRIRWCSRRRLHVLRRVLRRQDSRRRFAVGRRAHVHPHSGRRRARGERVRRLVVGGDAAAAILGGTLAAGSHFTKAGSRAVINTSPEPFSNWAASFGEDLAVGGLLWLAFAHPIAALSSCSRCIALMHLADPEAVALHPTARRASVGAFDGDGRACTTSADERRDGADVRQDPDRQPRRDRVPRRAHRAADGHPHRRRLLRRRARRAARRRLRRGVSHRPGAAARELPRRRRDHRDRAKRAGAQAIHPGYGFLSENETFAAALRARGPRVHRSAARGDRRDGLEVRGEDDHGAAPACRSCPAITATTRIRRCSRAKRRRIGYPVLIKATAGGGGKGMKIVERAAEFAGGARLGAARGEGVASATTAC